MLDVRFRDMQPDVPLAYDPGIQEVYADAIGSLELTGANFRTVYVTYGLQGGALVRVPVVKIIRPVTALLSGNGIARILGINGALAH